MAGANANSSERTHAGGDRNAGPLAGYRVLEMGSTVAGPFCGRLLADFGAEVIKIEAPEGDAVRMMGKRYRGRSLYAASIFRNKRLVAIDMRQSEGRRLVRDISATCDVLVENFRPGTLERWGLDYETLGAANPGLVMVRISGYGQDGPYSSRPGYGVISEAVSGVRHMTGDPDRRPARVGVSLTDYVTGLYAALGAAMALLSRQRTGRGQVVDAALYEGAFSMMEPYVPAYAKLGETPQRYGSGLPDHVPNNLYVTGDGGYIHITAANQSLFHRLVEAMERPELVNDPRFADPEARVANEDALNAVIEEWAGAWDLAALETHLIAHDIPAARVFTLADIFGDPHYAARGMVQRVSHEDLGDVAMPNVVPRLSRTPGAILRAGGRVGRDTRDVLQEIAGLESMEIDRLRSQRTIVCADGKENESA